MSKGRLVRDVKPYMEPLDKDVQKWYTSMYQLKEFTLNKEDQKENAKCMAGQCGCAEQPVEQKVEALMKDLGCCPSSKHDTELTDDDLPF